MLSYSPIEDEVDLQKVPPSLPPEKLIATKKKVCQDETECNLVVMFFVVGVILLAVLDSTKK